FRLRSPEWTMMANTNMTAPFQPKYWPRHEPVPFWLTVARLDLCKAAPRELRSSCPDNTLTRNRRGTALRPRSRPADLSNQLRGRHALWAHQAAIPATDTVSVQWRRF